MPTTNPVPSTDPSDLLFNAGKLDEVVNGTANSFTDRLGVARRTVAGMNADFDAQLADAESDLNVYRADAAASAAEALGYLQTIRATSYGAYASDPATDPLGNPPTVGDEYFNTTANLLKRWNGTTWQASDINTANLAAPSGSSLVGYLPSGTGAVPTTVQGVIRQKVSIFGHMTAAQIADAKSANPTLDLAPAFQACVNDAPASGCLIEIPPGVTITVGANIVWKSNLYLHIGAGSTIKRKDNSPDAYRVIDARGNLTSIGFYGPGKIDANAAGQPAGNKGHGLAITAKNAIVIGMEVCNVPMGAGGSMGDGIILEPDIFGGTGFQCENIYIQGGRIRNIARQGVTLESGLNVHVLCVKFDDIGAYAIDVENAGFTIGDVDGVVIENLIVNRAQGIVSMVSAQPVNKQQNIVCSNCIGDTIQIGYTMRASKNITVQGGYLTNVSEYAVYLYTNGVTTASDITIKGLTSKGTSTYAIYAQAGGGGRFSNIVIEDCDLENTVRCVSVDGLTYKNNKVKHNTSGLVASGCTGMDVLDNTVVYVGGGTNYREIDLSTITGLTIGRNRTTGGLVGLAVQACSNIKLHSDNDFSASSTPFLDAGTNTNWTGRFTGTFTMGAANQINVPCKFWKSTSIVTLIPTNSAAAVLQSGTKMLWIDPATSTENSQFRVKTADGVAAAGTETFQYVVTNS